MRANEFITEYAIARFQPSPELNIIVDSHYQDRFYERGVGSHRTVALMLQKLPSILPKLREIDLGDKVWIYKPEFEVSLGMQRNMDKKGKTEFVLRTVIPWEPHKDGITQIIII